MAKWYEYRANQPNNGQLSEILHRLKEIERRQAAFEQRLAFLERRPAIADRARTPLQWSDEAESVYQPDMAGTIGEAAHRLAPWVSTSVRFAESLTSVGHVKAMALQAALMGISAGSVGGLVAWRAELPVLATAGGVAVASFALTFSTLLIINRGDIHALVRQQAGKSKNVYHRVQIDQGSGEGSQHTDFLFLKHDIDREDLRELAQAVLDGKSLAVHGWIGVGGWTRTKFDNAMAELEKMGYVRPGRGNVSRELTAKGRALFRSWAE
jgi:hypothetical protein